MKNLIRSFFFSVAVLFVTLVWASSASISLPLILIPGSGTLIAPADSDTIKLQYPMRDESEGLPQMNDYKGGLYLEDPSNIKTDVSYDPDSNQFNVTQKMGNVDFRPPIYMTQDEYVEYEFKRSTKEYWKQRSVAESMTQAGQGKNLIAPIKINSQAFDRIFGSNVVDIRPQGSAQLIFGVNSSFTENPVIPVRNRRITTFDFDQQIQLSLIGKIGDRLRITTNYNTEATFDFENRMKLEFTGGEDDIIKNIEAGNVSLPLNSTLISGSQSLFGIKTVMQFGKATVSTVISQEKGQRKEINIEGGAQLNSFEISGDNYEVNKHFFLSQYFKDQYDSALKNLPVVNSLVNVTRVEVWITNTSSNINETRNIIALTDLGENLPAYLTNSLVTTNSMQIPDNMANSQNPSQLLSSCPTCPSLRNKDSAAIVLAASLGYRPIRDFEKVLSARKLSPSEFTFNPRLGFVSLNTNVNPDQVIAVAYQYAYNGNIYQVGELSTDGIADPKCLFVKMLKSTNVSTRTDLLLWDLMMKNVYSIGAYQVKAENFKLNVYYNNPASSIDVPVLPETGLSITAKPLLQVMNLDRINIASDAYPDGVFDFIDGVTINAANGRIYFPVRKPFGTHLREKINPLKDPALLITENKYAYDQLYDSTKIVAQQVPEKNRFRMKGSYKSSSGSEISLNAPNIPEGSVSVTAGGVALVENVDYTVDYALGKLKIINNGILQSGTPIKVAFESNVLFGFQQKTLIGMHMDYRVNRDFSFGATAIRVNERPIMQKVNIGDEPIRNTVLGLNGNYRSEFPFLTRMVDKLPIYSTKEISTVTASGEIAALLPGHSPAIGKEGNAYLDDFEGSQTPIDIKPMGAWSLASTPQGNGNLPNPLWPEGARTDTVYGFNRAKIAWYTIDPMFMRQTPNLTPDYYTKVMMSDNFQREIFETEIFPKKESQTGQPVPLPTLDLAFYPSERGQFNYDAAPLPGFSAGTNTDGSLLAPQTRWGGIMRRIETMDFEAANVQSIQIWVMDPFNADCGSPFNNLDPNASGELVIHLGNVSEDVLRDGKNSFENGLPISSSDQTHPTATTSWGRVPKIQAIVNAFDNDPNSRASQDVGLDGFNDSDEAAYFSKFLGAYSVIPGIAGSAVNAINADPSSDDYHYYRGTDYDNDQLGTLDRYKKFNGTDGNSPVTSAGYPTSSTTLPNSEDINRDNNLTENEGYYQYRVKISAKDLIPANVGTNFINDVVSGGGTTINNTAINTKWYQIKIPVREYEAKYGNIDDFRSIRFIRMILRGFEKPVILRMARLDLIRGEWRKYDFDLANEGEYLGNDDAGTSFDVSAVNFQENGTKLPVNYVLPPQIEQQLNFGPTNPIRQNEQAMALKVCNLEDGDARATFKNVDLDVRSYKKLRMHVHAEAQAVGPPLKDDDLTCFIRLGTDYTQNYYECEIPLKVTPPGVYNNNSDDEREYVWIPNNNLNLDLSVLQNAKQMRNEAQAALNKRYHLTVTDEDGHKREITIKGNPNLADVKTIMIGVRNPKKLVADDDGLPKCGEVWVNELRLADFDERSGMASTGHVTTKLADLGTVSLAGNYSTPGWGSIEKRVSERQRETKYQYDISTQLLLHKFIPSNWGINLPMYIGYSQAIVRPQFNPLDPDLLLNPILNNENLPQKYRDSLRLLTVEETERRSINFVNVRKERPKTSKRNNIWDVENFAFSYSYSQYFNRTAYIEYNGMRDHQAGVVWGYSTTPKNIQPLKKAKWANKKVLALLKDFNFNPYPGRYAFTLNVDRHYAEKLERNTTGLDIPIQPFFDKRFSMLRGYDLKYDITKSLRLDYHADNTSRVLEAPGAIDTQGEKDSIRDNLLRGGNNTMFAQRAKLDYAIPIQKVPLFDWVTANAGYSTDYRWTRAPYSADSLGNMIQNGNQATLNTQGNLVTLYNKVPFLKKVNAGIKKPEKPAKQKANPAVPPKTPTAPTSTTTPAAKDTTKKKSPVIWPQYVARTLMMAKNVSVNFSNSAGMALSGYKDSTRFFGMHNGANGLAPGPGFVFGQQNNFGPNDTNFADYAAQQGWLVKAPTLNTPFTKNKTANITGRANLEPMPGLKIELTANRNQSRNFTEFFRWAYDSITEQEAYLHQSPTESGNFSMSFITWKTAFERPNKNYQSDAFDQFLQNRSVISKQLAMAHTGHSDSTFTGTDGVTYYKGYGPTSQSTLAYAFLTAYSGKSASGYAMETFPKVPLPNWRLTYDGLSKWKVIKKYVKTVMLSHAYRCSYSFNYINNLVSGLKGSGETPVNLDANNNYIFYEQINSISIAEQFSPLIKIDVSLQNSIQLNVAIKRERNLALSFANNQLTEVSSREFVIGAGYRWKNLVLKNPFKNDKNKKGIKSDLNLKVDLSRRDNLTMIRKVVEGVTQPTAGQVIYSLKTSADYQITQRITARLFYDWLFTDPRISTSFRSSNTNGGISVRFSLT